MNDLKQVEVSHYDFKKYMDKRRWTSIWHQINELSELQPRRVLEIGPGIGLLKQAASLYGVPVETFDIDPELKPDHLGSVTEMPFADGEFDVVCAFQMLEHIPYELSIKAFAEMSRVADKAVLISLPNVQRCWRLTVVLPRIGERHIVVPKPFARPRLHVFDGEHHWELFKEGYEPEKVIRDFSKIRPLSRQYRVPENPYHHFFIFA